MVTDSIAPSLRPARRWSRPEYERMLALGLVDADLAVYGQGAILVTTPTGGARRKRWRRDEYYRLGEEGFFDGQRVELIDGEILPMSPQGARHAVAIELTLKALLAAFGEGTRFRPQLPLAVNETNEPEPDFAVLPGSPRGQEDHPSTAPLVIEISETTLNHDRTTKAKLYAQAGVPEYWIVNLVDRRLEVHREPTAAADLPTGARYARVFSLDAGASIQPLSAPTVTIKVADLLP